MEPTFYHVRRVIRKLPGEVIREIPIPTPEVTEGFGARRNIGAICRGLGAKSVLLVTDRTIRGLGFHEAVTESLEEAGIPCAVFSDIDSEPTVEIIRAGQRAAADCSADCIVALGGGSVLDSSKIIAAGAKTPERDAAHYLTKFAYVKGGTLPMVTVPTTAGTGAEHTVGAVVKNERGVKCSTVVIGLDVRHVVLDSELTVNAPASVTVWCGIDAMSHGLEGVLADVKSSDEDAEKSRACVRLVLENLPRLLDDPHDIEARQNMFRAAHYGGNAINRQLAGYVHAFAHSIGALYHIPHGKAIAHCLLPVLSVHRDLPAPSDRLAALAVSCSLADPGDDRRAAVDKLFSALKALLDRCGLEHGCSAVREEDYPQLVKMIDADSVNYSPPKTLGDGEIRTLLDAIRKGD